MVATFFGHSTLLVDLREPLENLITELVEKRGVSCFYVGDSGAFDAVVRQALESVKRKKQGIRCEVVLSRLPTADAIKDTDEPIPTLFPECMGSVPPRFAIDRRNRWMLQQADIVVVYVTTPFGGAAKFKQLSEKAGREVINLADLIENK